MRGFRWERKPATLWVPGFGRSLGKGDAIWVSTAVKRVEPLQTIDSRAFGVSWLKTHMVHVCSFMRDWGILEVDSCHSGATQAAFACAFPLIPLQKGGRTHTSSGFHLKRGAFNIKEDIKRGFKQGVLSSSIWPLGLLSVFSNPASSTRPREVSREALLAERKSWPETLGAKSEVALHKPGAK